jgi:glycine betaine catabolism A
MKSLIADRGWSKKYPELGTGPVSSAASSVLAEFFELERDRIFRRSWLNIGTIWEIPEPGDYFVCELAICNASIFVMRGRDRKVRGFYNVCSHRGNKLVADVRGTCRGLLTCNFRSWAYDSTGQLKWVPDVCNPVGGRFLLPEPNQTEQSQ